ncbi:MAG: DUF362 domain-containing protein [Spirochaetales bacterium]|nr:DUF362 domain-containing protein [Spirochaetales bacterium]
MNRKKDNFITRRAFLRKTGIIGTGIFLFSFLPFKACKLSSSDEEPPSTSTSPQLEGRVVHTYSSNATSWDFDTEYYGNHVSQTVVDDMVNRGIKELTGKLTVSQAWQSLIPGYSSGKTIAIKVNFNNCYSCSPSDIRIDALIHPVNSIIQGLKQIGVEENNIWIYDAVRNIPSRFTSGCPFSNVQFISKPPCTGGITFVSSDPDAFVTFSGGTPPPNAQRIADVLIDASYLINIPIVKAHGSAGITLSFKNHFGTIQAPADLHDYISDSAAGIIYSKDYNPMVDIYLNPHIKDKTILTMGDALFGNWYNNLTKPPKWLLFGDGAPNSLFFATDPVSIDCVMADYLNAEYFSQTGFNLTDMADDYLVLAENAGLGIFERGNPLQTPYGSGYTKIDYTRIAV